jgi:hypothetical protein
MVGQPQVVVAAERGEAPAIDHHFGLLRGGDHTPAPIAPLVAALLQCFGQPVHETRFPIDN